MELEIKNKGFSLIELLVALALFSAFALSATGVALAVIQKQRKAFATQNVQEAGRYILEAANKEIRTSILSSSGGLFPTISMVNADGQAVVYAFDGGVLKRNGQTVSPTTVDLTGAFYISKFDFPQRSLVTIFVKIKSKEARPQDRAEIYLQSAASLRP